MQGKIVFTTDQIAELWKYVDDIRWVDMVLIGIYTGFRPQELAIIETINVHLDEDKIIGGMKLTYDKYRGRFEKGMKEMFGIPLDMIDSIEYNKRR